MKQIKVYIRHDLSFSESSSIEVEPADKLARDAIRNRSKIIEGVLNIDRDLVRMISHYFYGSQNERKQEFDDLILNSNFCSFSDKRKLINYIINKESLLKGSEKNKFDQILGEVITFRNAFAHGRLLCDDKRAWIRYFEGSPQKKLLTDEYLEQIEVTLRLAGEWCSRLGATMGIKLETIEV